MGQHIASALASALRGAVSVDAAAGEFDAGWSRNSSRAQQCVADLLLDCSASSEDAFHRLKGICESPIEVIALAGLLALLPNALAVGHTSDLENVAGWTLAIVPQVRASGYRLDLAVLDRPRRITFALECDGQEFHVDRRKDCDRTLALWRRGVIVERVSGTSLYRDPRAALTPFARKVGSCDIRLPWLLSEGWSNVVESDAELRAPATTHVGLDLAKERRTSLG